MIGQLKGWLNSFSKQDLNHNTSGIGSSGSFRNSYEMPDENTPDGGASSSKTDQIFSKFEDIEKRGLWTMVFQTLRVDSERRSKDLKLKVARKPENHRKNRYRDVLPFDHSRVKLTCTGDGDYINASLVPIELAHRLHILCQGPLPHTAGDFWAMVWEQQTPAIIMLNRIIEKDMIKCHQYYPSAQPESLFMRQSSLISSFSSNTSSVTDGTSNSPTSSLLAVQPMVFESSGIGFQVTVTAEETLRNFTKRTFTLQHLGTKEERSVAHFQYTTWPDFGVPGNTDDFLEFLLEVRKSNCLNKSLCGPTVIHCSAGIGRSGSFILVDAVLVIAQLVGTANVDILDMVANLRQSRIGLIQTPDQLRFSWKAIIDALTLDKWKELLSTTCCETTNPHASPPDGPTSSTNQQNPDNEATLDPGTTGSPPLIQREFGNTPSADDSPDDGGALPTEPGGDMGSAAIGTTPEPKSNTPEPPPPSIVAAVEPSSMLNGITELDDEADKVQVPTDKLVPIPTSAVAATTDPLSVPAIAVVDQDASSDAGVVGAAGAQNEVDLINFDDRGTPKRVRTEVEKHTTHDVEGHQTKHLTNDSITANNETDSTCDSSDFGSIPNGAGTPVEQLPSPLVPMAIALPNTAAGGDTSTLLGDKDTVMESTTSVAPSSLQIEAIERMIDDDDDVIGESGEESKKSKLMDTTSSPDDNTAFEQASAEFCRTNRRDMNADDIPMFPSTMSSLNQVLQRSYDTSADDVAPIFVQRLRGGGGGSVNNSKSPSPTPLATTNPGETNANRNDNNSDSNVDVKYSTNNAPPGSADDTSSAYTLRQRQRKQKAEAMRDHLDAIKGRQQTIEAVETDATLIGSLTRALTHARADGSRAPNVLGYGVALGLIGLGFAAMYYYGSSMG